MQTQHIRANRHEHTFLSTTVTSLMAKVLFRASSRQAYVALLSFSLVEEQAPVVPASQLLAATITMSNEL